MDRDIWEKVLLALNEFQDIEKQGFKPLDGVGGERHGGWVWTCYRKDHDDLGTFTRYVSFAIVEEAHSGYPFYIVEMTAGADDSIHFAQVPVASYRYVGLAPLFDDMRLVLQQAFRETIKRALTLQRGDLTEVYPRLKGPGPQRSRVVRKEA